MLLKHFYLSMGEKRPSIKCSLFIFISLLIRKMFDDLHEVLGEKLYVGQGKRIFSSSQNSIQEFVGETFVLIPLQNFLDLLFVEEIYFFFWITLLKELWGVFIFGKILSPQRDKFSDAHTPVNLLARQLGVILANQQEFFLVFLQVY